MIWTVNLAGLALIGLVVWWFFLYSTKQVQVKGDTMTVSVENGVYIPDVIEIQAGRPVTLNFLRKDDTSCAEVVVFDGLNVSAHLPVDETTPVALNVKTPGVYAFTCQMGMYRGKLIVV